jgi:TPP-dependent pyruvate/acetoin dehydrogenase alpha subunit
VADRAKAYGIPGVTVDGMDVLAVYEATQKAVKRARAGKGPMLIECETYRYVGHSRTDPQQYRPAEEVESWKCRDAIQCLRARMVDAGVASDAEFEAINESVERELDEAVEFSKASPHPLPEDALKNVFVGEEACDR